MRTILITPSTKDNFRGSTRHIAEAEVVVTTDGRIVKDRYGTVVVWTAHDGTMKIELPDLQAGI